jgi:hypothetical protein
MTRAALGVFACLTFTACWNFEALLNQCDAGLGPCTPDAGEAMGGGAGGGGGAMGGGGGTDAGEMDAGTMDAGAMDAGAMDAGTATPDCDAGTAGTLQTPDGSTAFCFNGFAWENPLPHGADLSAVWGPAPDDVWAGGAAGMLMHWDGTGWTSHQGEIGPQLIPPAPRLGWITSMVRSPTGTWLAGNDLQPHWLDGGVWLPSGASAGSGVFWRIASMGVSPSGMKGPFAVTTSGEVYLGPNWTLVRAGPTPEQPDSVRQIAVGDDGLVAFSGTFQLGGTSVHRVWTTDGGRWTLDAGEPGALWLERGQLLTASTNRNAPSTTLWVLTDAGATQRVSYSDDVVFGAAHFLPALDGGFLVGSRGTVADTWGNQLLTGTDFELRGVWAFADGGSWAVGAHGALLQQDAGLWVWRQQGFTEDLFGLWVTDAGAVFMAGGGAYVTDRTTLATKRVGTGTLRDLQLSDAGWLVASEDGKLWRSVPGAGIGTVVYPGSSTQPLNGLIVDDDEAWAVGINTVVHRQPDGGWVRDVPAGVTGYQEWWKVARAGNRFVAVGSRGYAAVYTLDAGWQTPQEPMNSNLYGVWTIDPQTLWVVGGGPGIWLFHPDTGVFDEQSLPANYSGSLFDVWGSAPDDVWAVGSEGLAFHYDGRDWLPQETGTRALLERVRSRPLPGGGREVIIVGQRGTVLRKRY